MNSIDMIIAVIIILVVAILIHYGLNQVNGSTMTNVENLINTDDSRMKELTKCCTEPKCYSKPPFMRENCEANKVEAKKELDTMFDQAYTQEEYYKKLNELNFIKTQDMPNVQKEQEFVNKLNERITLDKAVGNSLFDKIVTDKQDEVCGYNIRGFDTKDYAPFIPIK
jgi:hypothetical protein